MGFDQDTGPNRKSNPGLNHQRFNATTTPLGQKGVINSPSLCKSDVIADL
jgi:hypothetical protein